MKNFTIVFALVCMFAAGAHAAPQNVVETLANSNELNQTVAKSTSVSPSAISVSTSAATRIDSAVNTRLTTALGAAYQRAEIIAQNTGTTNVYCAFGASEATTAAGFIIYPGNMMVFKLGKHEAIYCLGETTAGTLRVGGLGWK
jgi:hypothetical protein